MLQEGSPMVCSVTIEKMSAVTNPVSLLLFCIHSPSNLQHGYVCLHTVASEAAWAAPQ